jgi:hypothetical protein
MHLFIKKASNGLATDTLTASACCTDRARSQATCRCAAGPRSPHGKKEQDPLVRLLVGAGTERLLMVGAIAVLVTLAWLAIRVVRRPRVYVIQVSHGEDRALWFDVRLASPTVTTWYRFSHRSSGRGRGKVPTVSSRPDLKSSGSSHSLVTSRFSFVSSGLRRLFGRFRGFKRLLQFDRPRPSSSLTC